MARGNGIVPPIVRIMVKLEDGPNGCWIWQGMRNEDNYGKFRAHGKSRMVHRFMYEYFIGPIPEGLYCLHECDNPPCCNPEHLFVGNQSDNMQDMIKKNRDYYPSGEESSNAAFTNVQAKKIRERLKNGEKGADLAREFSVTPSTINKIKQNRTYRID